MTTWVDDHREQFLRAYLRHRVGERLAGFEQAQARYTAARRWTTALTVLLFTAAAALGAVAVADDGRRALWAFLATVAAALATAVGVYEAAFSFRALSRRSANGVALLHLLQAHGAPEGEDGVNAFRTEVESVLRHAER
jgi:peptidoglycan/LPS O-acetylase OafA/YrhL